MQSEEEQSISKLKEEFKALCKHTEHDANIYELVKKKAFDGQLKTTNLRGLCWLLFFECLPKQNENRAWRDAIQNGRKQYENLKDKHLVDPHKLGKELDPSINNPLSQVEDTPWARYFQNEELRKLIIQDVERIYPEYEFFHTDEIRDLMVRILFLFAAKYPDISYRQGMHELLGPIVYVMQKEKFKKPTNIVPEDEDFYCLLDRSYIEHDSYIVFEKLLKITGEWFKADKPLPASMRTPGAKKNHVAEILGNSDKEEEKVLPIIKNAIIFIIHY